jgi:ankyrin repeat protein
VLLDAGLDVNSKTGTWTSPLAAAATLRCSTPGESLAGNLAVMDLLIERGADPDAFDTLNNSILMSAVQQCPLPIVQKLLDAKAQAGPVNKQDFTPLEMALVMGKIDIAELLVARGARRDPAKLDRLFAETPEDPRLRALLAKAAAKGK